MAASPSLRLIILCILLAAACLFLPVPGFLIELRTGFARKAAGDCRKVLFLGNSLTFSYDIPGNTERLSRLLSPGRALCVSELAKPGVSLEWHWHSPASREALARGWDYVVLQEQSARSYQEAGKLEKYLRLFVPEIRRTGAQPLIYQILSKHWSKERHALLRRRMEAISGELGVRLIPVDLVWVRLLSSEPADSVLSPDLHHPGPLGSYSAALLFTRCIAGISSRPGAFPIYKAPRFVFEAFLPIRIEKWISEREAGESLEAVEEVSCGEEAGSRR